MIKLTKEKKIPSLRHLPKKYLSQLYEKVCMEYIDRFCKKQELDFEWWIGDRVGEIAGCGDFYFNFSDIMLDIDTDQPKGDIITWYYESLDYPDDAINYFSYTKGLRIAPKEPQELPDERSPKE
jgi:hypothetical protein